MKILNQKRKNIMLVGNDHEQEGRMLAAFEECGLAARVLVFRDGEEALDYIFRRGEFENRLEDNPAAILLDCHVPKIEALEVLKTVKAAETLREIPVIALTASEKIADVVDFYKHGVHAYLIKPVQTAGLIETVRRITCS